MRTLLLPSLRQRKKFSSNEKAKLVTSRGSAFYVGIIRFAALVSLSSLVFVFIVPQSKNLPDHLSEEDYWSVRKARPGESVLVTGGLGFIGSHVVDLLLNRGFEVTILDNESNGHNHNSFANEMAPRDITIVDDFPDVSHSSKHFTHVIHLAAAISVAESVIVPEKYENVNYLGSQKVLDWIDRYNQLSGSNIQRVVAASSAAIYGDPDPELLPLVEATLYGGLSPYADTKFRMEGLMRDFVGRQMSESSHPQTSAVALRFFNVYGPRQDPDNPYSGVISLFLEMASKGQEITILGDGEMTRDFVYVKDVARAIILAMLHDDDGFTFSVYNVCTGKSISINTLAKHVKQIMGSTSSISHIDPRKGDIRDSSCNPGAAKAIGFVSAVSQEAGLEKTARWFKEKRRLSR